MKIIQISSVSSSYSVEDYKADVFKKWYARVAFQLKKFYPQLEVECWTIEKKEKKERELEKQGIKFRVFPTSFSFRHGFEISLPMLKALENERTKAKKQNKRLILHIHGIHTWQTYILLFLRKNDDVKIIAQHHGGRNPFWNLKKYKRLILALPLIVLMKLCENILFKKIEIFYALSKEEINYLKKIAPKSKIKFQTMGISNEYFKKVSEKKARRKLNLGLNKRYILYIGRIKKTKGIKELLDTIKELEKESIELLLIGGGTEKEVLEFKNYAKNKDITNVKFLGSIYGKEKLEYLSASDCLILPSYTEGAPVVIMEAIAKNLPVIATNVGGVSMMIKNGKEGIIIKPKSTNEIVKAINQILSWKKMDIRKYAEKYKWKRIIEKTFEDYCA